MTTNNVQTQKNNDTVPFIRNGFAVTRTGRTIAQNGGRTLPLLTNTVLGRVGSTGKYAPLALTGTTGIQQVAGIYVGPDIPAADLVAGDVDTAMILVGANVLVDADQIVLEAGTLQSNLPSNKTVEEELQLTGIFPLDTEDIASFENA